MNEGWKCPLCGNVYAPFVQKCPEAHGATASIDKQWDCPHEWTTDTAGTRCWKCGIRVSQTRAP